MRTAATVGVIPLTLAVALCATASLAARPAEAQLLRGIARTLDSSRAVERAQVMALNMSGKNIGTTTTDDRGFFTLKFDARGAPFVVSVRRLGFQPTSSQQIVLLRTDTLDVEFLVSEVGILTDTVRVTAKPMLNELRLIEARRRGWRVFEPKQIAERRETVNSFGDLIRGLGYPGLVVGNRPDDCIRSTRNNKCLTIVVDGVPLSSGNPLINPRDVYFLAVLGASDAAVQFGDRAPWGAIVVYTRMRGDKM